jgi:predicted nucleotidyltransferase
LLTVGKSEAFIRYSSALLDMPSITEEPGSGVFVPFPLPDVRLFRNQAIEDVLLLFVRNPHETFTVTELRDVTGAGGDTIATAIEVLEAADIIETRREGRKKLIEANKDRFENPDDPLLSVPQEAFRTPIEAFLDRIEDVETTIVGVVLFGSVARGEADRASDIDLQVIVDGDLVGARRELHDVRQDIENERFDGDRYAFQLLVESVESVENYGEKLQEVFSEGIVLEGSERLTELKRGVFSGEE